MAPILPLKTPLLLLMTPMLILMIFILPLMTFMLHLMIPMLLHNTNAKHDVTSTVLDNTYSTIYDTMLQLFDKCNCVHCLETTYFEYYSSNMFGSIVIKWCYLHRKIIQNFLNIFSRIFLTNIRKIILFNLFVTMGFMLRQILIT